MAKYDYDLIVLGGGSAGLTMAMGANSFGLRVMLIDNDKVGGDCLHYGCIPSKTIIKSAKVVHQINNAKKWGIKKASVQFDFSDITKHIAKTIGIIKKHETPAYLSKIGIKTIIGSPKFISPHEISVMDKTYSAKNVAICTGSHPFVPQIDGLKETGFITNMQIFSLKRQPAHMAIIGGGPIGTEMAQAFARLGTKITILERSEHILIREEDDLALELQGILQSEGVDIVCRASVVGAKKKGGRKVVVFEKGGKKKQIVVDEILVAVGRRANMEGLGLENAGVEVSKRGIITNRKMQTSARHIYAAGDVVGPYLFTHTAEYMAKIALTNMIFKVPKKTDWRVVPWVTFTDPELAHVGLSTKEADEKGIKYHVVTIPYGDEDRAITDGQRAGKVKMLISKNRLIGVSMLGHNAGEVFHEYVLAMQENISVSKIASMIHAYPTTGRVGVRAIGAYFKEYVFTDRFKKLARFLYRLW